ncbi:hypothetical protein BDQ12DRAFT_613893, partial [Crucibulum laeve]
MLVTSTLLFLSCNICYMILGLAFLPSVSALPLEQSFPEISFQVFSNFVLDNFNSDISLSTVLLVLFTMTNNTALLNLSARAQHPVLKGETTPTTNGWIKALAYALNKHLKDNTNSLLTAEDISIKMSSKQLTTCISRKLNKLSQVLQLSSYNSKKQFLGHLKSISHAEIKPVLVLVPES